MESVACFTRAGMSSTTGSTCSWAFNRVSTKYTSGIMVLIILVYTFCVVTSLERVFRLEHVPLVDTRPPQLFGHLYKPYLSVRRFSGSLWNDRLMLGTCGYIWGPLGQGKQLETPSQTLIRVNMVSEETLPYEYFTDTQCFSTHWNLAENTPHFSIILFACKFLWILWLRTRKKVLIWKQTNKH